jgi:hypothetical protein
MLMFGTACTQSNPAFSRGSESASEGTGSEGAPPLTSEGTLGEDGSATTGLSGDGGDEDATTSASSHAEDGDDGGTVGTELAKRVFVTSVALSADQIGGLEGADGKCQALAERAGVSGTYRAWLSDANRSPATSMSRSGPYVLVDGRPVASDWSALISGSLDNPIDVTETGASIGIGVHVCVGHEVWTNTLADGTTRDEQDCQGWSSAQGVSFVGYAKEAGVSWTESPCINVSCASPLPLYCVEQ